MVLGKIMSNSYNVTEQLHSSRKSISVISFKGRKCVIKIYPDDVRPAKEARIMQAVSRTGYAPEVLEYRGNYLIAEYIEGQSFAELFRSATMSDDEKALENLASRLCIFLQMFYTLNEGLILGKADFDDFVIVDDRCCCVSFSGVKEGLPFQDIAGIVAYAMCNAVGNCYSAYPFVRKVLECFHLGTLDIINDMDEYFTLFSQEKGLPVDREQIEAVLLSFDDKAFDWEMIASQRSNE